MKRTAIVTGGTAKDVPAMACLVMNIKDTNPNLANEMVIFHDGISVKDQKLINSIFPTRFIFYRSPFEKNNNFENTITQYFTKMLFCKYECLQLLDEYETVIWTDYDIVILRDISVLISDLNKDCAFITDIKLTVKEMFNQFIWQHDVSNINMDKKGICTPLFILKDTIYNYDALYKQCIELTEKFADSLYLAEQCIFNIVLQTNKISYVNIPYLPYCTHPVHDVPNKQTNILHAYGQPKFWNGLYNNVWEENYNKWIQMGGSHYPYFKRKKFSYKVLNYCKKILLFILPHGFVWLIQRKRK